MTVRPFGTLPDGRHVDLYSITADGIEIHAMTYGGIITSLKVPDRYGEPMTCSVTYLLIAPRSVELRYDVITDAPTIVNLTQHTYFNLASKPSTSVLDHELTIHASYYTPVNPTLIPTGQIASVDGTALDFQQPVSLRRALGATHPQLAIAGGFDHNFFLHRASAGLVRAATLHEPRSGRVLHVSTTEPALQLYDGHRLDGATTGVDGRVLDRHAGLCLESRLPHHAHFPSVELRPTKRYRSTTRWEFLTE